MCPCPTLLSGCTSNVLIVSVQADNSVGYASPVGRSFGVSKEWVAFLWTFTACSCTPERDLDG